MFFNKFRNQFYGYLFILPAFLIISLFGIFPVFFGIYMSFHKWKKNDVLCINRYGMPEPAIFSNYQIPDIIMVPLIAFDNQNNRLGYGKGYYDLYLGKFLKKNKNIITIGVAFSFHLAYHY